EQVDHGTDGGALQRAARHRHPRRAKGDRSDRSLDTLEARAQHVDIADEGRDETVNRAAIDLVRVAELADAAFRDHGNPVRQAQRLALVVRDEDGRHAELALNFLELDLHRGAQVPIERGEWLVEQQHLGTNDESARERHALLLTARELAGFAIFQARKLDERERVGDPAHYLRLGDPAHAQAVADIRRHVHVGEQRVVLEHDADLAPIRRDIRDPLAVDGDLAAVRHQKAGDEVEQRGLAAAGRPEQRYQLAATHQQRDVIERGNLAETFGYLFELDRDIRGAVRPRRRRGRSGKLAFSGEAQR